MLACWSPHSSLLLLSVLWILLPISYLLIKDWSNCSYNPTSYKEVRYISVESDANQEPGGSILSRKDMLFLTWKIQKLFIPLFVGMFCKNLLLSGIVTTIAFTNIPITPRNQYLLYTLAYGTGELLSRPYLGYLSLCAIEDKFVFKKTWIPALLQVFVTMFMVFDSWFRLIPELYLALAMVTLNNFLLGILYVNSFLNAGEGLRAEEKRFCRAFLAGALWSSNIAASLISLNTEPRLRQHCRLFYSAGIPETECAADLTSYEKGLNEEEMEIYLPRRVTYRAYKDSVTLGEIVELEPHFTAAPVQRTEAFQWHEEEVHITVSGRSKSRVGNKNEANYSKHGDQTAQHTPKTACAAHDVVVNSCEKPLSAWPRRPQMSPADLAPREPNVIKNSKK